MAENPYRPPTALVADPPAAQIHPESRKPLAVWLLQILATIAALAFAYGFLIMGYWLISEPSPPERIAALLRGMLWRLGASAVSAILVLQVQRRTASGRILGLAMIVLQMVLIAHALLKGRPGVAEPIHLIAWGIASFVLLTPVAWWAWSFAFSRKARSYFAPRTTEVGAPQLP